MILQSTDNRRRLDWILRLAITITVLLSVRTEAQNINAGEIRGVVTDSTGAAVPNAEVTLTNNDTGVTTKVSANASGVYDLPQLTPGSYTVSVGSPTFKTFVEENVLLRTAPIQVNAVLVAGTVGEKVTVDSGDRVQLQTEDSEQNLTLDAVSLTSLPNIGNSWWNATVLIPGVNGGGSQNQNGQAIGINGAESYQESFLLNGGQATLIGSQNPDWIIAPTDFIAETNFETHTFNATSGGGLAVLNVITKNGTNQFHGSFWDYNQNSAFAAQNYFSGGSGVPPSSQNTFGGTAGGPIKRDKLFFFGGYQRQVLNAGTVGIGSVPTADMKAGNFAGLPTIYDPASTTTVGGTTTRQPFAGNVIPAGRISQQATNWEQFFPDPNYGAVGATTSNYRYSEQVRDVTDWYTGKLDYNFNAKNHFNASGTYGDVTFPNPALLNPIGEFAEHGHEFATQISHTWVPSSTLINEARFSMIRFFGYWDSGDFGKGYPAKIGIPGTVSDVWPSLSVTGGYGYGAGLQANISETEFVPSDVATLVRGKHIIKLGGEYDADQVNGNFSGYSDGNFSFNGVFSKDPNPADTNPTGAGYADFLLGDVSSWSIAITPEPGERLKTYQLFAQDDFKVRPNLTLNLGLRFEVQPGWYEAKNRVGDFDPNLLNPATGTLGAVWEADGAAGVNSRTHVEATSYVSQPRVGFSWSPIKNWAVRGGIGVYAELLGQNTYGGIQGIGLIGTNNLAETDGLTPAFTLAQGPPPPIYTTTDDLKPESFNGQSIAYNPYHTKLPTIEEYQLDVQHEFARGIVADAAYVGSRGRHLALALDSNQVPANQLHNFTGPGSVNMSIYRPYQQFQGIPTTLGGGISNYDALQLRLQKQFTAGWQFVTNFTYAHSLDEGTGSGYGGAGAKGDVWQNGYDLKAGYGNSLLDQRLTFNGDVIYDLPVGQGKMLLNRGGFLNSALGGWRLSGLWQLHTGIPFSVILPNSNQGDGDGSLAGTWFPNRIGSGRLANRNIHQWFDPSAFIQPAYGTYGNSGRNVLYGPGWQQLDLSLQKHWAVRKLGENADVQVRVDASDVSNNPNFGQPNGTLFQSSTATITNANTSRVMQFEGKFSF